MDCATSLGLGVSQKRGLMAEGWKGWDCVAKKWRKLVVLNRGVNLLLLLGLRC